MTFTNRQDAGRQLARALEKWRGAQPVVVGLPRGGVVVAAEVAQLLAGELEVLLVKKLRAPGNPELALGAVSADGQVFLNDAVVRMTGALADYLDREIAERRAEMAAQQQVYQAVRPHIVLANRPVILVDDGLATGATMIAAVQTTALLKPRQLVVAVPVSPPESLAAIRKLAEVDDVVCLHTPAWFQGVGQFYDDFTQTSETQVVALLPAS